MKNKFCGFYSTPDEFLESVWKDRTTLFVLDTNCLLNLYRCEDGTREEIINVMKELSPRIWIPFQVGYEYQRARRTVIEESISSLSNIKQELIKFYKHSILEQAGIKKHLYNKLSNDISTFQEKIQKSIDTFISSKIDIRIESKEKISKHDFIRDELDKIISENVGNTPTQKEIDRINELGEERYEKKIPPGFKDSSKKGASYYSDIIFKDKFGDLYLWEQVIEKAKEDNIETVVFVSDDLKEDWVFIHKGKNHGPLESLKTEICKRSNLKNFRLINQLSFLHEAKKYISSVNVSNETLKEVKELIMTPVHTNASNSVIDSYFEHEFPDTYKQSYRERYATYFNRSQDKSFKAIKDKTVRIEKIIYVLDEIINEISENLSILHRYSYELNKKNDESSIEDFKKTLLLQMKKAQILSYQIKEKNLSTIRPEELNEKKLELIAIDLEAHIMKLKELNDIAESYINTLL